MRNRSLLFLIDITTPDSEVRKGILSAAAQNAHVVCLVLGLSPAYPFSAYGAPSYAGMDYHESWATDMASAKARLAERADALEALLQREGVSGDVQPVLCALNDVAGIVARRALVCDLAFVAPSLRAQDEELFQSLVNGVLFMSPIPLRLIGDPLAQPERVFVAWNAELPSARAVHAALPLLGGAKEVYVGWFDPDSRDNAGGEDPGLDLGGWLSHHGCEVTVNQYPGSGMDVSTAILRRARELGCDLVVMGAYGRSRLREFVFGGTTREMLAQDKIPVLLAH